MTDQFGHTGLPANVLEALQRGDTIGAIKLLRQSSGLGLKEAKDIIDLHVSGNPVFIAPAAPVDSLPAPVRDALSKGNKIEAIRLLREQTGLGLKEAKDAVEAFEDAQPATADGLAPGEVSRSGSRAWPMVLLILVIVAGYYFFGRGG